MIFYNLSDNMIKPFALSLILAALGAFTAEAQEPADYKLEVQDFTELKVTDAINVDYHCSTDSAGWAYFTTTPDVAANLLFSNNKACLNVQLADVLPAGTPLPTLHVYSSALGKVENSADSTVRVISNVPLPSFKARVVGNGTLVVRQLRATSVDAGITTGKGHLVISNGTAARVKLSNVGTGPLEAGGLKAQRVKVMAFGTGPIDCCATESLTVYGAGSCTVHYDGNPEKVTNRSIGVKLVEVPR